MDTVSITIAPGFLIKPDLSLPISLFFFRYSYFLSAGRAVILFSRLTLLLFSQPLNRVTFCDLKTGPRLFMINNREKIQKNIAATETLNRCCLNAGPPFAMLRHHWNNIAQRAAVSLMLNILSSSWIILMTPNIATTGNNWWSYFPFIERL